MTNVWLNEIMEIIIKAVFSILTLTITYLVAKGIDYMNNKTQIIIEKVDMEKYNLTYNIAKDIYFTVEQQFKFIPESALEKRKVFDSMLLQRIPNLKQEDLDHFREAIVGEINSEINKLKIIS
ncbi:hypothetical protein [Clostridium rectalis]|uniref:hypothetical protein n=1 Tax=Clostridium rectalis TaxID=2040295 RepID=UPI000F63604F|nr:hypothetical protein [Clostridium rectalis]